MSDWKQERLIDRGRFEVVIDLNEHTEERRIAVYRGETILAIEFVRPIEATIERLVGLAFERLHQFPGAR